MITIGQMADWILEHRSKRAFFGYTHEHIVQEINESIKDKTFTYYAKGNEILGVLCGKLIPEKKIFWVHDILTIKPGIVRVFMDRFLLVYPEYKLEGQRSHRMRKFDKPKQLKERIDYGRSINV